MSTFDLIFPKKRAVCFFCQEPLLDKHGRYVRLMQVSSIEAHVEQFEAVTADLANA